MRDSQHKKTLLIFRDGTAAIIEGSGLSVSSASPITEIHSIENLPEQDLVTIKDNLNNSSLIKKILAKQKKAI